MDNTQLSDVDMASSDVIDGGNIPIPKYVNIQLTRRVLTQAAKVLLHFLSFRIFRTNYASKYGI